MTTLTFENGAFAVIDNSRKAVYGYDQRVEVFGSAGMVTIANNTPDTHILCDRARRPLRPAPELLPGALQRILPARDARLRGRRRAIGSPVPVGGEDGLKAAAIRAGRRKIRARKPAGELAEIRRRSPHARHPECRRNRTGKDGQRVRAQPGAPRAQRAPGGGGRSESRSSRESSPTNSPASRCYANHRELLDDPGVEAVLIVTLHQHAQGSGHGRGRARQGHLLRKADVACRWTTRTTCGTRWSRRASSFRWDFSAASTPVTWRRKESRRRRHRQPRRDVGHLPRSLPPPLEFCDPPRSAAG